MRRSSPAAAGGIFSSETGFPTHPVQTDRLLKDGDRVELGGVTLTAHRTPGHTKGNTTWAMQVEEGGKKYAAVFVGSATILPGVVLMNNPQYPGLAEDWATTFRVLKSLPCDVFLASHASFYAGPGKAGRLKKGEKPNPFLDPEGYREYVEKAEKRYLDQLHKEKEAAAKAGLPPSVP